MRGRGLVGGGRDLGLCKEGLGGQGDVGEVFLTRCSTSEITEASIISRAPPQSYSICAAVERGTHPSLPICTADQVRQAPIVADA